MWPEPWARGPHCVSSVADPSAPHGSQKSASSSQLQGHGAQPSRSSRKLASRSLTETLTTALPATAKWHFLPPRVGGGHRKYLAFQVC